MTSNCSPDIFSEKAHKTYDSVDDAPISQDVLHGSDSSSVVEVQRRNISMDSTRLTIDLRQASEDKRREAMRQNKLVYRGGYISNDSDQKLFTTENLRGQVRLGTSTESPQELQDLVDFIKKPEGLKAFERLRANGTTNVLDHAFSKRRPQITTWIAQLKEKCKEFKEPLELLDLMAAVLEPRDTITDPMRTEEETLDHLGRVIQKAKSADLELKHKPMTRARKDSGKDESYRKVLVAHDWYDQETTEGEKRACAAERFLSTFPTPGTGDPVFGMEEVLQDISRRFEKTNYLALVGLRGVGCVQQATVP
jgi:hypothetical protein